MDQVSPPAVSADDLSLPKPRSTFTKLPFWVPHAITAALMLVIVLQIFHIFALKTQIRAMNDMLVREGDSLAMISLRLNTFEVRDPAYQAARIAVAWDATQHQGVITTQNLPAPATGYNYQLWVLDPGALTPFSAGVIHTEKPSTIFKIQALSTVNPGFAISLEPVGGSAEPTGSILFAVEPGQ